MAMVASRLEASAAVTLLTEPIQACSPKAAATTSYRLDSNITAIAAPYQAATGERVMAMMRPRMITSSMLPTTVATQISGRNCA